MTFGTTLVYLNIPLVPRSKHSAWVLKTKQRNIQVAGRAHWPMPLAV